MPISPGDKLGPYECIALIGKGGMGEVYKARDTRLDRIVALKVSAAQFSERFEREAKAIAALNHPHICQLYDVGPNYLVMEYIEGTPLKGPLPLDQALKYAAQICDALDAAHKKGITHRDLKPANILVTKAGIKLLDFGLAKLASAKSGTSGAGPASKPDDATLTMALTGKNEIVGTLYYMSPEQLQSQANGQEIDGRSDIFSFGLVLYEMLTGKRAFEGSSPASVIAAIMERPAPSIDTIAPPALDRLLQRCLAKDSDDRWQTARDLKAELEWIASGSGEVTTAPIPAARPRLLPWIAAGVMTIAAIAFSIIYSRASNTTAPETRVDIVTPPTTSPASFALSPDGRKIAYMATSDGASRLWVRSLDSTSAQPLPGTENAINPFWSPDSRSLGFFADNRLKRIDLGGGRPQALAETQSPSAEGTWGAEGVILSNVGSFSAIFRVPASGGQAMVVTKLGNGQAGHATPRFLPGGRQFLFTVNGTDPSLWLGSLGGEGAGVGPRRIAALEPGIDSEGEFLAPGWLVRVRGNDLVAQRFDASRGQLSGDPVTLAQAVGVDLITRAGSFSVASGQVGASMSSPLGTIAWRSNGGGRRQLIWFSRSGENAGAYGAPADSSQFNPELSPDGKRAVFTRGPVGSADIWMEEDTRTSRFTFDPADDRYNIWSPDGARVVFASTRKGNSDLYQKAANGSGSAEVLLQSADTKRPNSWSPDGRFILFWSSLNHGDLMVLPLASTEKLGDRKPFPFLSTPFNEQSGAFSPDGKWVAYLSNESGRNEVCVRPFPGPGGQWQVSTGGGDAPRWRADGKELYYVAPDFKLMAVAVVTTQSAAQGATFTPGTPQALFQTYMVQGSGQKQQYDVARDGRFLINTELQEASTEPIHLLLNWHPPK